MIAILEKLEDPRFNPSMQRDMQRVKRTLKRLRDNAKRRKRG